MKLNLFLISLFFFLSCASGNYGRDEGVYHLVKKDQTLWRIAKTYNVPLDDIIRANRVKNVTDIKVGRKIFIPGTTKVLEVIPYRAGEQKKVYHTIESGQTSWQIARTDRVYHTIEPGQTLWRIAKTYGVSLDDIIAANQIKDVTNIEIGRKIFIPEANKVLKVIPYQLEEETPKKGVYHLIEKGQTLWRIANTYDVALEDILTFNKITDVTDIEIGRKIFIPEATGVLKVEVYRPTDIIGEYPDFIWPVEGKVLSGFGSRNNSFHKGIDIRGSSGTAILAAASGVVAVSRVMQGYGNVIILTHAYNFDTVYAHNSVNLVEKGEEVQKGQLIAEIGMTGRATGPHLHFEIRDAGIAKDPLLYLLGR